MTQSKNTIKPVDLLINFIRKEVLNEDIRTEIIKPILIYLLYYPFCYFNYLIKFFYNHSSSIFSFLY